jgi:hypothetical protein
MQNKNSEGLKLALFFVILSVVIGLIFYLTPPTVAGM